MKGSTPSQTVGPFFNIGLGPISFEAGDTQHAAAKTIQISGQIFDGDGVPVPDAQLELWHADPDGCYSRAVEASSAGHKTSQCFLRAPTNELGTFSFQTTHPGPVSEVDGSEQAPHIVVMLFMRGLLRHLYTRIYFADDPKRENDRILLAVPADRRYTLLAQPESESSMRYRWDVHLQGVDETVFFAY